MYLTKHVLRVRLIGNPWLHSLVNKTISKLKQEVIEEYGQTIGCKNEEQFN